MPFDPFRDFDTAGYLRNRYQEKDARIIKRIEHEVFSRHISEAIDYLSRRQDIEYTDFLKVHKILFSEFYPWAGQDRAEIAPRIWVRKGDVEFCDATLCERAINEGLQQAKKKDGMKNKAGTIMGCFAYGHPFLDGNGRTLLLVHMELCHRYGFSIAWHNSDKNDYLNALTNEIDTPNKGILDSYLAQFIGSKTRRSEWGKQIGAMKGLDGLATSNVVVGDLSDASIAKLYDQRTGKRNYEHSENKIVPSGARRTPKPF